MFKILFLLLNVIVFFVLSVNCSNITNSTAWKRCLQNFKKSRELQLPWKCTKNGSLKMFNKTYEQDTLERDEDINYTRIKRNIKKKMKNDDTSVNDCLRSNKTWSDCIFNKIIGIIESHILEIDLGHSTENEIARHRRRNQMLPMMVFGITALGMVLVPLGFQFLAVLGGKALLLSKMALLLASINGLKKVATSGVSYGLYHADPHATNVW